VCTALVMACCLGEDLQRAPHPPARRQTGAGGKRRGPVLLAALTRSPSGQPSRNRGESCLDAAAAVLLGVGWAAHSSPPQVHPQPPPPYHASPPPASPLPNGAPVKRRCPAAGRWFESGWVAEMKILLVLHATRLLFGAGTGGWGLVGPSWTGS
jgi:hypothetical protein